MGVSLALKKLERALDEFPGRVRTLGPIIHNPQALERFQARGVVCINSPDEAGPEDVALIRAHGVPRADEAKLRDLCARVEDATCPKVKKAQLAIEDATATGARLLLFGEAAHPEVRGLVSYARGDAFVFGSPEELAKERLDPAAHYVLAAQTTQDQEIFAKIEAGLRSRLPRLAVLRTICDATRLRQEEALDLARRSDAIVVVGGKQSGNTRRLAALAAEAGARAIHVETAAELTEESFAPGLIVGLTAGASTPKNEIDAVERRLLAMSGQ